MADCSGFIQPLNLECLLINTFADTNINIFIFVAFIFIAVTGASFRMLNFTIMLMFAIFGIFMANYSEGLYFLIVLLIGLIVAYIAKKTTKN